ncbi:hypothetical protein F8388_006008 [Cannabis sativa]|uniref:Uncharacterized protein n=1 Tax=Cannabis sativa TaxID=3483 RepID=A0A7J6H6G1_CANSA|nr:hypothetical protein F8388_006008 [Cannabis sativa]
MVFFLCKRQKIPNWAENKQSNRAGYWKETEKYKEIYKGKLSCWNEENAGFLQRQNSERRKIQLVHNLPRTEKNEREICRIFQKSSSGKKIPINGFSRLSPFGNEMGRFGLPPLNNSSSPYCNKSKPVFHSMNVPCFSSPISNNNVIRNQDETWLIP